MRFISPLFMIVLCRLALHVHAEEKAAPGVLPGELTAEEILNGVNRYPASPKVPFEFNARGFDKSRLTKVPALGIHPRILLSPEDLPGLRRRVQETETGRILIANLRERVAGTILKKGAWENDVYNQLAAGDIKSADEILSRSLPGTISAGHYQPQIPYMLTCEAFDCMLTDNAERGKKVAAAIAGLFKMLEPRVDACNLAPMHDDIWRCGTHSLLGNSMSIFAYCYDFAYNFMTDEQRKDARRVIAKATRGKTTMGFSLPAHWRNWNWICCGQSFPVLALAIEGEEGYDPRIYKKSVEVLRDYWTYGFSEKGSSTEAVGYTQFGLVWATPAMIAMARRGDNLFTHSHYRASVEWYLQSMQPWGREWLSHGDGGNGGPALHTLQAMKFYYPDNSLVDYQWQNMINAEGKDVRKERIHLIEPLICAMDGLKDKYGKPVDYKFGEALKQPVTFFDPARGSLITRDKWDKDAAVMQFECRPDQIGPSHQHQDRGNFTFSAQGKCWAADNFRSVESRHHNVVLIDGKGQGDVPTPGKWLGLTDKGGATFGACDSKYAYDWLWSRAFALDDPRLQYKRWEGYKKDSAAYMKLHPEYVPGRDLDPSPYVVNYYKPYLKGDSVSDPRMWDEWAWPSRLANNPVQRAFRTAGLVRGKHPYALVIDDIQKDDKEHLYEWTMMSRLDVDVLNIKDNDVILCDAAVNHKPKKGDPLLLVRVLEMADPAKPGDYSTRPSIRFEAYDRKDTTGPDGRSFGMDKRLIIPSRSVAPNFKIMLLPHRMGDPLPKTEWNAAKTALAIEWTDQKDEYIFKMDKANKTQFVLTRAGKEISRAPESAEKE